MKSFLHRRCKKSTRKHKKWEGDAVLTVRQDARLAVLKDLVSFRKSLAERSEKSLVIKMFAIFKYGIEC
jgi:hypothetical protein